MAQRGNLKFFYWGLAVVAVAGGAWIWVAAHRTPANAYTQPLPASEVAAAAAFPGYVLGSDSAPVVVDDYSDFECPFCAELALLTFPDVRSRLINAGVVRWRFHDRPLASIHPKTLGAHEAAVASPAHLRNMLEPRIGRAGIGVARELLPSGKPRVYLTEIFVE